MSFRDYFAPDWHGPPFNLFGPGHVLSLVLIAALALALTRLRGASEAARRRARLGLALSMAAGELSWHWWTLAFTGGWTLDRMLPLHMCTALAWLGMYTLLSLNPISYEFVYFLGIGGALQAVLTPDAAQYGLPHFRAVQTMVSHGLLIVCALYLTIVEGLRPTWRSIPRVIVGTLVYMLFVSVVNVAVGGDYMFTLRKPPTASVLDSLGPWPWYLLPMIGLGILNCVLLYLPFVWIDRRRTADRSSTLESLSPEPEIQ
jgi:hypothetical integral membrane protein (TIGR02206 family)